MWRRAHWAGHWARHWARRARPDDHTPAPASSRSGWGARGPAPAVAVSLVLALVAIAGSGPAVAGLASGSAGTTAARSFGTVKSPAAKTAQTAQTAKAPASGQPVRLGPTDPATPISITVSLVGQSPAGLAQTVSAIHDPRSPEYQQYLTPAQFAQRFGAAQAVQARVASALRAGGLAPSSGETGSLLMGASGTVGQVEALFGVTLDNYRDAQGHTYYAPEAGPHLPQAMQGAVVGVLGLDNRPLVHRASTLARQQASAGNPPPHPLGPTELREAYNITPLSSSGLDGSGQTMAFAEIDTFKQSDIDAYDKACGLDTPCTPIQAPPVEVVQVHGGADPAKDVSETTLDIEVVHAIAPKTHLIAYEGPADFAGLTDTFSKIVSDNRAQVMSVSLGGCEPAIAQAPDLGQSYFNTLNTIFQQAAAQGMTVLVASGDDGAYTCSRSDPTDSTPSISVPADSPYVTAVGGTALFVDESGGKVSYSYEAGWEAPLEGAGGGGGVSVAYPLPSWQTGNGVSGPESDGMRQIPDVSASADPMTGYKIYDSTSSCSGQDCWTGVGGTSAAAPLWASLVGLANQQAGQSGKKTMGFINTALYAMGRGELGPSPFHDITLGGNLFYQASPGWDFSTGWGTPDANAVVKELVGQAASK